MAVQKKNQKSNFKSKGANQNNNESQSAGNESPQYKLFATDVNLCQQTEKSLNKKTVKLDESGNLKSELTEVYAEKRDMVDQKTTFNYFLGDLSVQEVDENPNISVFAKMQKKNIVYKNLNPFQNSSKQFRLSMNIEDICYTNLPLLVVRCVSGINFSITPPRMTGLSSKEQRRIRQAVIRARILGLLPFCNS